MSADEIAVKANGRHLFLQTSDVVSALIDHDYTVIHVDELPKVTVSGGKPRVERPDPSLRQTDRSAYFGLLALQKLALAAWYDANDAGRNERIAKLALSLREKGVPNAGDVAISLINEGLAA